MSHFRRSISWFLLAKLWLLCATAAFPSSEFHSQHALSSPRRRKLAGLVGPQQHHHSSVRGATSEVAGSSVRVCEVDGVDWTVKNDSSVALQAILTNVWKTVSYGHVMQMNPSLPDLGNTVLDFCGGHYLLARPIVFPSTGGGNLIFF